jgi:signal transduction histidine kinase
LAQLTSEGVRTTAAGDENPDAVPGWELSVASDDPPEPPAPPGPDDQVISALIHELSAPITVIEGFVEMLKGPLADQDEDGHRRAVAAITRNAVHLRGLLSAFADARRIDVDALDLRKQPTDVGELVAETVESLRGLVAPHPIQLRVDRTAVVDLDPVRVRQAVINLVQNAAKFSLADAPIEIVVSAGATSVRITITDHGSGIAFADRGRVFGKFVRLRADTPGTGLGLYISRGIARAHGGDLVIDASSSTGSRFTVTLPIGSGP